MRKIIVLSLVLFLSSVGVFASSGAITKPVKKTEVTKPIIQDVTKNPTKGMIILGDNYAVDDDFVYVVNDTRSNWVKMPDADRRTFKVLAGQFARDADQIFQMGKRMAGVDMASFSVISGQHGYAQDKNSIYGPNGIIKEADVQTFKLLTKSYSIDAGHVFFDGKNIREANSGSFEVIENGLYAVDDKSVFYAGKILEGVSPEGFVVKGPRAFAANGNTFFEGRIEKGEKPIENPDTTGEKPHTDDKNPLNISSYKKYFSGEFTLFWALNLLALMVFFSFLFVFFAERNDESATVFGVFLKMLVSAIIGVVIFWVTSFFAGNTVSMIVGVIGAGIVFVVLSQVFGWIKSILITLLTLIAFVFIISLGLLIARAIFGDIESVFAYILTPQMRIIGIMKLVGIFVGGWLIVSQLRSSLFYAAGQALVSTCVSLCLVGLLLWIGSLGTILSVVLFSSFYAITLWIMRFRMVSNLFAETVRIVRIAIIIALFVGVLVWIIL